MRAFLPLKQGEMPAFLMSHIFAGLDTAYTSRVPPPDGKGKQKGKNAPEEKKSLETVMVSRLFLVDDTGLEPVTSRTSSGCSYQLS